MTTNLSLSDREPLAVRAAITAAVVAVVHTAVVLGLLNLDASQETAVGAAVDAAGLVVLLIWTRPRVVPAAKVVTRVTTDGGVITGEAAALGPDRELLDVDESGFAPTVEPVAVDPELVAAD